MTPLEMLQSCIGKEFENSPSPFMQWLKPIILSAKKGHLKFQYQVRNEWLNPAGNLHGGAAAGILDDIIGATIFTLDDPHFFATINNSIDYFSSAREDDLLIAETKIIKLGRQFANVQCEIWNEDMSRLILRGTSNLFKNNATK